MGSFDVGYFNMQSFCKKVFQFHLNSSKHTILTRIVIINVRHLNISKFSCDISNFAPRIQIFRFFLIFEVPNKYKLSLGEYLTLKWVQWKSLLKQHDFISYHFLPLFWSLFLPFSHKVFSRSLIEFAKVWHSKWH